MIRALLILLTSAAGGWVAASWLEARPAPGPPPVVAVRQAPPNPDSLVRDMRQWRRGSRNLTRLAAELAKAPASVLPSLLKEVESWAPGVAKETAAAILEQRNVHGGVWDPFARPLAASEVQWHLARLIAARIHGDESAAREAIAGMSPALKTAGAAAFKEADPAALLEAIEASMSLKAFCYSAPMERLFTALSRLDAVAAVRLAQSLKPDWRGAALSGSIGILAVSDPAAAVRVLAAEPREYGRMPRMVSLLRTAAAAGPEAYARVVAAIPDDCGYDVRHMATSEMDGSGTLVSAAFAFASGAPDDSAIRYELPTWLKTNPAAAMDAVLKLPVGSGRTNAIDTAAGEIAVRDPAAALAFFRKAGEQKAGTQVAAAWTGVLLANPAAAVSWFHELNFRQRVSLAESLAGRIGGFDIQLAMSIRLWGPLEPAVPTEALGPVWAVLRELPDGNVRDRVIAAIGGWDPGVFSNADSDLWSHFMAERQAQQSPDALAEFCRNRTMPATALENFANLDPNRMSLRVLERLSDTGHVAEAAGLLQGITDPDKWAAGYTAVVPAWQELDPAAARAALDTSPLTGVERERLRRSTLLIDAGASQ